MNKTIRWFAVISLLLVLCSVAANADGPSDVKSDVPKPAALEDGISLYFSPKGGCTDAIVHEISSAKTSIKIQAYRLTSKPIAAAILKAHRAGVSISIVLDKMQQSKKYSDATFFSNMGMKVLIDPKHAIAHSKIILIDEATIITGSFNFSANAEDDNAENLLIIKEKPDLMRAYLENFSNHEKHSVPYRPIDKSDTAAEAPAAESSDNAVSATQPAAMSK